MSTLGQDLRFAARMLAKQPLFSLMIVAMLSLGIAGTSAIFSVYNSLFLRSFPFEEPERLVDLDEVAPKWNLEFVSVSYPDFHAWRAHNRTFEGMAVFDDLSFNLSTPERAERVEAAGVTHDLLAVLRLKPALGRGFTAEEDRPAGAKVALLSYGLWQRMFGGKADVLGQTLRLDAQPYTVVGVLPREAVLPDRAELWVPLGANPEEHRGWYLSGVGRLKPSVTLEQAREDLTRIHKGMIEKQKANEITSPKIMPLRERYLGDFRIATQVLLGAVAVVLLIACVNIAGLMLARGTSRSREIGIRVAMGASRASVIRLLLTESVLLSSVGGLAGVGLGFLGLEALVATVPDQLPRWVSFQTDARFLLFCVLITGASAVLFGFWPAVNSSRIDIRGALHDTSARASVSAGRRRSLNALIIGEVALAVVLLVGAGLLFQAFQKVQKVDPGFRSENILVYRLSLPDLEYSKPEQRRAFFKKLMEQARTLPGVVAAGAVNAPPLGGHWGMFFEVENAPPLRPDEQDPVVLMRVATPGYFEAIGIRLLAGRTFNESDGIVEGNPVAIVNESFARRYWPRADPVGKRLRFRGSKGPWMTVIGFAHDIKHYGLDREMRPGVYLPYTQRSIGGMAVVLRTATPPGTIVEPSRQLLHRLDPNIPMFGVKLMSRRLEESLWVRRTYSWLIAVFATVALALAAGGIYGVISYTVTRRTQEIGIRMALGARREQLLRQVLGQGLALVFAGLVLGLAGAFSAAGLLESLLFGISARDPLTYAGVSAILLGVAFLANLLPARRAAAIDPMTALRFE